MRHPRSRGHICFRGFDEWFERDGQVYRAPSFRPVQPDGYRHAEWYSGRAHFDRYRKLILGEQSVEQWQAEHCAVPR